MNTKHTRQMNRIRRALGIGTCALLRLLALVMLKVLLFQVPSYGGWRKC